MGTGGSEPARSVFFPRQRLKDRLLCNIRYAPVTRVPKAHEGFERSVSLLGASDIESSPLGRTNLHRTENWYESKSSPIGVTCSCQPFYHLHTASWESQGLDIASIEFNDSSSSVIICDETMRRDFNERSVSLS